MYQALELNKRFEQKLRDRDDIIFRAREANRQLRTSSPSAVMANIGNSATVASISSKDRQGKRNSKQHVTNEDMEAEIEDLKSLLDGRDNEVKVCIVLPYLSY